jgi:hypothetical protein
MVVVVVVVEVVARGGICPPMGELLLPWGNYISRGGITSPMEEHPFIHPLIN